MVISQFNSLFKDRLESLSSSINEKHSKFSLEEYNFLFKIYDYSIKENDITKLRNYLIKLESENNLKLKNNYLTFTEREETIKIKNLLANLLSSFELKNNKYTLKENIDLFDFIYEKTLKTDLNNIKMGNKKITDNNKKVFNEKVINNPSILQLKKQMLKDDNLSEEEKKSLRIDLYNLEEDRKGKVSDVLGLEGISSLIYISSLEYECALNSIIPIQAEKEFSKDSFISELDKKLQDLSKLFFEDTKLTIIETKKVELFNMVESLNDKQLYDRLADLIGFYNNYNINSTYEEYIKEHPVITREEYKEDIDYAINLKEKFMDDITSKCKENIIVKDSRVDFQKILDEEYKKLYDNVCLELKQDYSKGR